MADTVRLDAAALRRLGIFARDGDVGDVRPDRSIIVTPAEIRVRPYLVERGVQPGPRWHTRYLSDQEIHTMTTPTLVPIIVTIDGAARFPAVHDPAVRWNGFICPYFTRPVVEQIAAWCRAEREGTPDGESDLITFDGDIAVIEHPADPDYEPERIPPTTEGLYPIGAMAWVWTEIEHAEGEARITVYLTLPAADLAAWTSDASLEGTVKATLHELNADDGSVRVPHVLGIDVETD
jgi:hypothetical protein